MTYQFDPNYVQKTLVPALNAAVFRSELQGNASLVTKFSYAGGASTYSFGLYQYDVGNNPGARELLTRFGFTSSQISQLSQHGGLSLAQQNALSNQLQAALQNPANASALQQFNNAWAQGLIGQLSNVLDSVAASGTVGKSIADQIFQSTASQVQIIDYGNQFHMSLTGPMAKWLQGNAVSMPGGRFQITPGTVLTKDMIRQFVMATDYGVHHSSAETNRENALFGVLNTLPAGEPASVKDDTPQGGAPIQTIIVNGRTGEVTYLDSSGTKLDSGQEKTLGEAASQAESGQASSNGNVDGTAASSTSGDGGLLPVAGGDGNGGGDAGGSSDGGGGYGDGGDGDGDGDGDGSNDGPGDDGDGDGHGGKRVFGDHTDSVKARSASGVQELPKNTPATTNAMFPVVSSNTGTALSAPPSTGSNAQLSAGQLIQSMASFNVIASATSLSPDATIDPHPALLGSTARHSTIRQAA